MSIAKPRISASLGIARPAAGQEIGRPAARAGSRDVIRFLLGDEPCEVRGVDPTTTVLEWLRLARHRMGTKEGCAEGDCGACTVAVGRPDGTGGIAYEAINACIRFLPMLDGCQLVTVEDVAAADGTLHPVQEALVAMHGSQCGFCTPGFVMSLWTLWQTGLAPTPALIEDTLAGNLCRCTGYGPIIQAAKAALASAEPRPPASIAAARSLAALDDAATLDLTVAGKRFVAPPTTDELAALLEAEPDATILAGATDIGLWVTKQDRPLETLVALGRIAELARIEETEAGLEIGACASYSQVAEAIVRLLPDAAELWRRIGSVQIRNAGTIGGNVANGSPIGDTSPVLIAAGATMVLRQGQDRRRLPVEDFFIDYGRQDRRPGEFLERLVVPRPRDGAIFKVMKISKRFDQDISAVCAAFHIELDRECLVTQARLAFGGMAATPKRAAMAEAALLGRAWTMATVEAAMEALGSDFTPLSDMRASAGYRLAVARNLLRKCFLESEGAPIRLARRPEPADA